MPWYKSGTVAVTLNSNAVIGTGTAFLANGRVGDAFRGPDGGWYEVTNIASDTAMSISPTYRGATASAGSYALAPMQGYVKDSADALRSLVNTYGSKLAAMGTAAAVDIQTSVIDPTAGRAMLNGAWGWGSVSADNPTDLNGITVSQKFGVNTGALNTPWAFGSTTVPFAAGSSGIAMTWTANHQSQIIVNRTAAMVALRRKSAGVWAPDDYFCLYPTGRTYLSVTQGGTGGNTPATARAGLELGSAATANVGTGSGNVMPVGSFGLGTNYPTMLNTMNTWVGGIYAVQQGNTLYVENTGISSGNMLCMGFPFGTTRGAQLWMGTGAGGVSIVGFRAGDYAGAPFNTIYHTGNTTRAADGTLKAI